MRRGRAAEFCKKEGRIAMLEWAFVDAKFEGFSVKMRVFVVV